MALRRSRHRSVLAPRRRLVPLDRFGFAKSPVGQDMSDQMTSQMVTDAPIMVIWRRGRPQELLHHSDQGSHYTSEPFQQLMADHGITCSMSRSGNVWDNAAMESFFSSLKTERIRRKHTSPEKRRILISSTILPVVGCRWVLVFVGAWSATQGQQGVVLGVLAGGGAELALWFCMALKTGSLCFCANVAEEL